MSCNIIDQILCQPFEGVSALSISSVCMLHRNINDPVRAEYQKITNLRQISICPKHGIHQETTDQSIAGNLQIGILPQHFGGSPHRHLCTQLSDRSVFSSLIAGYNYIHIRAFFHNPHHLRQLFRLMLEIIIHSHYKISLYMGKTA